MYIFIYIYIHISYIQVPSFTQITAAVAVRTGTPQGPSGDGHRSTFTVQAVGNAEPLKGA